MAWSDTAARASRAQLRKLGWPCTYTPNGQAPLADPVQVHVMRDVERERQDLDVVVVDKRTEALFLTEQVGHPRRGDTFSYTDPDEEWWIEDVLSNNGYVVRVALRPADEVPG